MEGLTRSLASLKEAKGYAADIFTSDVARHDHKYNMRPLEAPPYVYSENSGF
jgi:hypothetical protein